MTEVKSNDPFEAFRKLLEPGGGQQWLRTGAEQFWLNQDHLLDCMEPLQRGWLERRHEGTRAARQAVAGMCSAENPLSALREYQQWASGAFDRVMVDTAALQQCMSAAAISMFEPLSSPLAKASMPPGTRAPVRPEAKTAKVGSVA
jgi:hypothetical protein